MAHDALRPALAANAIDALPAVAEPERLVHVRVSEVTQRPPGWVEFCARQPHETCSFYSCSPASLSETRGCGGAVRLSRRREGSARNSLPENYTTVGTHLDDEDQNVAGTFASAARSSLGLMVKAKGRPNDPGMVVRADVSPLAIRRRARRGDHAAVRPCSPTWLRRGAAKNPARNPLPPARRGIRAPTGTAEGPQLAA